jgi:serine phosphatase RsbU (regulator of sigma subunit)
LPTGRRPCASRALTERIAANSEDFGEAHLVEVGRANRNRDATGLREAVVASVTTFGTGSFEDDVTILVVAMT